MLTKNVTTPFGVTLAYHQAVRIEGNLTDPNAALVAHVHGWPSEADYLAHEGKGASYVWYVPVPAALVQGPDLALGIDQALASPTNTESPFVGASISTSSLDVEGARVRRWANIKVQRELLDNSPIEHADYLVDADQQSRMDIMGALMAMQLTSQAARLWRCSDNVMRELALADLVAIGTAIAARRQALIETSDQLYQQLQAAQTTEEIAAIVWPAAGN